MTSKIEIKTAEDIEGMRKSGRLCAQILKKISAKAQPGMTPFEMNAQAELCIAEAGVKPAFLGYQKFPAVICASLNNVAVHGVPSKIPLASGDIIGIDFGVIIDGWYSDSALTVGVGNISYAASRLIHVTREALARGIGQAKVGNRIGDISSAIQFYVENEGFSVIRELVGHGIGKKLHEFPHVPNYGQAGKGEKIVNGMVLAIEPIIAVGSPNIQESKDGFGFETIDGSLVAHFEHTVAITTAGTEILTKV